MPRRTTALASLFLLALAASSPSGGAATPHLGVGKPQLFAPAQPLAVGDAPSALATIDMKGDGYDELLVVSAGSNRIEILSNRLGRLKATSMNPVGASPTAIATDRGGEGDQVLVTSGGSDEARTFYNDYFRTFVNVLAPEWQAQVGDAPSAALGVRIGIQHETPEGRLVQDGSAEWAVANRGSDDLSLLGHFGRSRGRLEVVRTVPVGDAPMGMVSPESGGDLYVANSGSGTITVVGGWVFNDELKTETIPVGGEPVALALADLIHGDRGEEELVAVDRARDRIEILGRAPQEPFQPRDTYHVVATYRVGDGPSDLVVANLDERLGPDIAVVNSRSNSVSLLRNDGAGRLTDGGTYSTGRHPVALAPLAYGRWFHPDLVVANRGSDDLTILVRREQGRCNGRPAKLLLGTARAETFGGDDVPNESNGLGGGDHVTGGKGADCLRGQSGDDTLTGGAEDDTMWPGRGSDEVNGQGGDDTIFARGGGHDVVHCDAGTDTVYADDSDVLRQCERTP